MTPNTERQLAEALNAIARQYEMQIAAKAEKTIYETIALVKQAAEAVSEDAEKGKEGGQ